MLCTVVNSCTDYTEKMKGTQTISQHIPAGQNSLDSLFFSIVFHHFRAAVIVV